MVSRARRSPEQPQDYILDLQRRFGNTAVTGLVQRAPRERAASTDVADLRGAAKRRGRTAKATPKKAVPDIHARVIKYDVDNGVGLITIGSGPDQGVQVGMSGSLVRSNGKEVADFTIEKAEGRVSYAHVEVIADQVRANPNVVIKASSFESMAGKEF